jgi:hypothetical protein
MLRCKPQNTTSENDARLGDCTTLCQLSVQGENVYNRSESVAGYSSWTSLPNRHPDPRRKNTPTMSGMQIQPANFGTCIEDIADTLGVKDQ